MALALRLPAGFQPVAGEWVFRAGHDPDLDDPRLVHNLVHHPLANFVLHRRRLASASSAEQERNRMEAELRKAVDDMSAIESGPFAFDDGVVGQLFAFEFRLLDELRAEQVHGLRLDGVWLSTITYTAPLGVGARLERAEVKRCLASFTPPADDRSEGADVPA